MRLPFVCARIKKQTLYPKMSTEVVARTVDTMFLQTVMVISVRWGFTFVNGCSFANPLIRVQEEVLGSPRLSAFSPKGLFNNPATSTELRFCGKADQNVWRKNVNVSLVMVQIKPIFLHSSVEPTVSL